MRQMKINSKWVIFFEKGKRYLVDVPPTGFKSTMKLDKATRFNSKEEMERYAGERGVFAFRPILVHFDA